MADGGFRFDGFQLDPGNRQLLRDGLPVPLNARYLDALALLVREQGRLVSKDRFLDEVWKGVPVTDEALTQCVRTLRRQLGDDVARPRFIETVPKHGYRFIAAVTRDGAAVAGRAATPVNAAQDWNAVFRLGLAGLVGGGASGAVGGLIYSVAGISDAGQAGGGSASALLVIVCLTLIVGALGGAAVACGLAAGRFAPGGGRGWSIVSAGVGGLLIGAVVKLVGLDAFSLLFGRSPGDITGGLEGGLLGSAIGLGLWLAGRTDAPGLLRQGVVVTAGVTGLAGALIPLLGGRLMGGSLDRLAAQFPQSQLRLDRIGRLFGESDFGPISQSVTGGLEGLLFGAGMALAIAAAQRGGRDSHSGRGG